MLARTKHILKGKKVQERGGGGAHGDNALLFESTMIHIASVPKNGGSMLSITTLINRLTREAVESKFLGVRSNVHTRIPQTANSLPSTTDVQILAELLTSPYQLSSLRPSMEADASVIG